MPSIFQAEADCKDDEKPDNEYIANGANNISCFAALANKQTGTSHTDITGVLHVVLLGRLQYSFFVYDYDTNYFFAKSTPDIKVQQLYKPLTRSLRNSQKKDTH